MFAFSALLSSQSCQSVSQLFHCSSHQTTDTISSCSLPQFCQLLARARTFPWQRTENGCVNLNVNFINEIGNLFRSPTHKRCFQIRVRKIIGTAKYTNSGSIIESVQFVGEGKLYIKKIFASLEWQKFGWANLHFSIFFNR